ncbi:MAG: type II CAAX prenyl endopeptidase Rce1 family protein [Gemmatimonadota bacterium]
MPRLSDLPGKAIATWAAIVLAVAFASRRPSAIAPLPPATLAAALFLYVPLFRYGRGPVPPWLGLGDLRRSALVLVALLLGGAAVFFLYASLPLPPGAAPPRAAGMPPAGEFIVRQALLAAVPEELFFRGYLYDAFEERGFEPVVPTSMLFAAGHLAIHASPYRAMTFFPALLFGWGRKRSGTLYVPALLHVAFNALPYLSGAAA